MIHAASHALGLAAVGAVVWLSGRIILARLGLARPGDLGGLTGLASVCLGLAWWTSALFGLAAAGFLDRWGLVAAAVPLAVAAVPLGTRLRRPPRARRRIGTAETLFAIFLLGTLLLTFFLAISPRVSWDADVYHLTLPRLYLEEGGFRPVAMSVYSHWPLATELLFAAAMLVGDYMLAKAVHFGFGLLVVYAFFASLAEKPRPASSLAAAFFLANAVVAFEFRVAYVDLAYTFLLLSGFIFLDRALEERGERSDAFLLLAGLCCGLLAGVKVNGILGAVVIGALWVPRLARGELRPFLVRFALPAVLLWVPWLVKAYAYTGNPVYPFFYDQLGGPDWSAALAERFGAWQRSIGMGRDALDYLLLPVRVTLFGDDGYHRFDGEISPFWLVLVPLAAVFGRRDPLVRRALAAAGFYFVLWAVTSQQMRLLLPALALCAVAGAVALASLPERLPRAAGLSGLMLAVAALLVVTVHGPFMAGGLRTLQAFAAHRGDLAETVVPEHLRFVDEHLPGDARLLFVNTNLGFFCRREYLADSFFEASQIADWLAGADGVAGVRGRLDRRGITHLVADARLRVPDLPPALARLLGDPRQVKVLFRSPDGRFAVLELR